MWINIVLFVLGGGYFIFSIYQLIAKPMKGEKFKNVSIESAKKQITISSLLGVLTSLAIILVGLTHNGFVITSTALYYVGMSLIVVSILADAFLDNKFLKKTNEEK